MKKFFVTVLLLAVTGILFAQDLIPPETEENAVALITQQAARLKLSRGDRVAATNAFKEMVKSGVRVENAWQMVSAALEKGLKSKEMTKLKEQVRLSVRQKLSAAECETSLHLMIQNQLQAREQFSAGTAEQARTQTQANAPAASEDSGSDSGSGSGAASGSKTGSGN